MASSLPPTSWGYNPDLEPIDYNPRESEDLLEAAGWKAVYRGGSRVCMGCETAEDGALLSISLDYQTGENRELVAELISQQLNRVGFDVRARASDGPSQQSFDAYLVSGHTNPDPDQWLQFSREGDVIGTGLNATSYHDDALSELLNEARTLPACEPDARAALYREAQALIQEQQPFAFLYARTDFIAAQPNVVGFTPLPGHPFWNMAEWGVVR
jgi:ABC-type transport system substrate-binding protein